MQFVGPSSLYLLTKPLIVFVGPHAILWHALFFMSVCLSLGKDPFTFSVVVRWFFSFGNKVVDQAEHAVNNLAICTEPNISSAEGLMVAEDEPNARKHLELENVPNLQVS